MSLKATTAVPEPRLTVSDPPSEEGVTPPFSTTPQGRPTELGKTFATRKIEVATLAIRATATQNAMFSVARAARSRRQRRESRSSADADRLLDTTRSVLTPSKQRQKSVTFSSCPPQVHEIETFTLENTSQIAEETEEVTMEADDITMNDEPKAEDEVAQRNTEENELAPTECSVSPSSYVTETSSMTDESSINVSSYSSKMASERKGQRICRNNLLSKLEERKQNQQDVARAALVPLCSNPSLSLPNSEFIESQIAGMLKRAEAKTSAFPHSAYGDGLHDRDSTTIKVVSEKNAAQPVDVRGLAPAQSVSVRKVQEWRESLDSEDSDTTTLTTSSLDDIADSVHAKPISKPELVSAEGRMSDFSRTLIHEFARITGDAVRGLVFVQAGFSIQTAS